jgi:hypothetical protein
LSIRTHFPSAVLHEQHLSKWSGGKSWGYIKPENVDLEYSQRKMYKPVVSSTEVVHKGTFEFYFRLSPAWPKEKKISQLR